MNLPLVYSPRILLTDDNPVNLQLLRASLSGRYQQVTEANTGSECLSLLGSQNIDLLLLDMNMPEINGFDVLKSIPELPKNQQPRVMIVSADHSPDTVGKAFQAGADDYLATPYSQEELLARVQTQLALRRRSKYLEDLVSMRTHELSETNQRLQQTSNQLLQAEKMASLGQLSAGIAHEINNPIAYINSNLQLLVNYCDDIDGIVQACMETPNSPDDDAQSQIKNKADKFINYQFLIDNTKTLLQESLTGVDRVSLIVQDLRTFSHPEQQTWQLTDINTCIESALNITTNEIKYKATVVKDFADVPAIECVAPQINQVLVNLLMNAAQAIDEHGEIRIATFCDNDQRATIEIEDNGHGINAQCLDKIYDPFFTTKPVGEGTGLGLSVSYGIIQSHNGHIAVDSEIGRGTKFTISLPLKQKSKTLYSKPAAAN